MIDVIYYKVLHYFILKKFSVQDGCQMQISPKDDIEVDFQVVFFVSIQNYILLHINLYIVCNMVNIKKLNANFQGLLSTVQPFTYPLTQLPRSLGYLVEPTVEFPQGNYFSPLNLSSVHRELALRQY